MIKTKLILSTLVTLLSVTALMADPISTNYTAEPEPVYGLEYLENQTIYPTLEQDLRNDGYVVLNFHVDVVGNISNIQVAKSGGTQFDASAIAAVLNTDWNPAMQNGTAVPVTFQLPFVFHAK
ncbi:MAG: energy transducer TonB [Candidatus Marinimicrobia bacterium]|nr:energy transducer TonB [Candidatus Neomarinimicrobiota bacterium]